jgi:hypothetical protein
MSVFDYVSDRLSFSDDFAKFDDWVNETWESIEDSYNDIFGEKVKTQILERSIKTSEYNYPIIYGEQTVGGAIIWYGSSREQGASDGDDDAQEVLHMVVGICEGDIQAIDNIYINDYDSTDPVFDFENGGKALYVYKKLGHANQTVQSTLIAESNAWDLGWRASDTLSGLAYVYLRMERRSNLGNDDPFGSGIPKITFKVKGRRVRRVAGVNYGSYSTHYSTNPIECFFDYLQHRAGGNQNIYAAVAPYWAEWRAAAEACNASVTNNGLAEAVFKLNLTINTATDVGKNARLIEQHMRARSGVTFVRPPVLDVAKAPAVTLNDDDLAAPLVISTPPRSDRYNRVSVQYRSMDAAGEINELDAVFPETGNTLYQTWLSEDGNQPNEKSQRYPGINNEADAQRMARYLAYRSRTERILAAKVRPHLFGLTPGDVVDCVFTEISGRYLVTKFDRQTLAATLVEQVPESVSDVAMVTPPVPPVTKLPSPTELQPPALQSINHTLQLFTPATAEGELSTVVLTIEPAVVDTVYSHARVRYKKSLGEAWQYPAGSADPTFAIVLNHKTETRLIVEAQPVSRWNKAGSWGQRKTIDLGVWATPNLPGITGLTLASFIGREARISWAPLLPRPEWLRDYVLQVVELGVQPAPDTVLFDAATMDDEFIISEDIIRTNNLGRDLVVRVMPRAKHGLTGSPSDLIVNNPKPSAPTAISLTANVNSVTLSWTPPANDVDFIGTKVYYRKGNSGAFSSIDFAAQANLYTLDNLDSSSSYQFKISSIDAFGEGDSTGVLFATTKSAIAPSSFIISPGVNQGHLTLTAPINYQGIKLWYGNDTETTGAAVYSGRDLSIILPELTANTTYKLYYRAIDGKGMEGPNLVGPLPFTTVKLSPSDLSGLSPWATKTDAADAAWISDKLSGDAIESSKIANLTAAKLTAGLINATIGISAGGSIESNNAGYKTGIGVYDVDGTTYTLMTANAAGNVTAGITADGILKAKGADIEGKVTISGGSGYGNLIDKPSSLAGINSTEGNKLAGVAEGADATDYAAISDDAQAKVDAINVGGRNLLQSAKLASVETTKEVILRGWAAGLASNVSVKDMLESGVEYTLSYEMELVVRTDSPTLYAQHAGILLYTPTAGTSIGTQVGNLVNLGDKVVVRKTFICPPLTDHQFLYYTNRYTTGGGSPIGLDTVKFTNLKLEKGNKVTDWTPAPEDVEAHAEEKALAAPKTVIDGGLITTGGIELSGTSGSIKAGKPNFNVTTPGLWLGIYDSAGAFHLGDSKDHIKYDKTSGLSIKGKIAVAAGTSPTLYSTEYLDKNGLPEGAPFKLGKSVYSGTNHYSSGLDLIPVVPGEVLTIEMWAKQTGNTVRAYMGLEHYDINKNPINSNTGAIYRGLTNTMLTTEWINYSADMPIPTSHAPYNGSTGAGVYYVRVRILYNYNSSGQAYYSPFTLYRKDRTAVKTVIDGGLITTGGIELISDAGAGKYGKISSGKTSVVDTANGFWLAATVDGGELNIGSDTSFMSYRPAEGLTFSGSIATADSKFQVASVGGFQPNIDAPEKAVCYIAAGSDYNVAGLEVKVDSGSRGGLKIHGTGNAVDIYSGGSTGINIYQDTQGGGPPANFRKGINIWDRCWAGTEVSCISLTSDNNIGLISSGGKTGGKFKYSGSSRVAGESAVLIDTVQNKAPHIQMLTHHTIFPVANNGAVIFGGPTEATSRLFARLRGRWSVLDIGGAISDGNSIPA